LPPAEHDWLKWSHDKFGQLSVDCDICKWVSLIDKQRYTFSVGKLLAASSLHCVNCRLNLNPCFFTYCACHVTISTSCVWPKGWFNPLCLLLTLNEKMHKQQTCVAYKWVYSLSRHLCLCSDAISKKIREALKPSLHCDEEPPTSNSAQTWVVLTVT